MSSNADTKPTLETVLERIDGVRAGVNELRQVMNERFDGQDKRFDEQDKNFADFDVRIDRIESVVNATRSEMLTLRADFREFKGKVAQATKEVA